MSELLKLAAVTKLYGRVIGVNDVNLELEAGAYGLLGPNGSGKSTLLNLITGQLRPTLGQVRVFGESPNDNPRLFRRLGYCPSSEGLYAQVSALTWVTYLLELHGRSPFEAKHQAEQALEMVGMTYAMNRNIAGYSRGMRQRTKMAQAIAHDPDLLILDEPFNGLDPIARYDLTQAFRNWISEGKSLIIASHVLHDVESITQSFLLICNGRLLASGTADEVQKMFVGLPNDIAISTNQPNRLAQTLIADGIVDKIEIDENRVSVSTRQTARLYDTITEWATEEENTVTEVHSGDDSLQSMFSSLLKIHRGEI